MERFCILIPTINRADLLQEALAEYPTYYPEIDIFVLDSGNQNIPTSDYSYLHILTSENPMGVSKSWNYLINHAISAGYENFLILNDDIILKCGKNAVEKLLETFSHRVFIRPRPIFHWCAFILTKVIYRQVGMFDENFKKCFFEDNDYEYRMRLINVTILYSDTLEPAVFRNSMSTQKDPLLGDYIQNKEYYIRKWGGEPNNEKYLTPFGA